jgi:uncharacterized protein YcbX
MAITVTALSTTPIKGTRIRTVDSLRLGPEGALGDRAFYVVDAGGSMVNGKRLACLQTVVADYRPAEERLGLSFPDGTELNAPVRLGAPVATTFFGDPRAAHELDGPFSAALSEFAGEPLRLVKSGPARSAVDRGAEGTVSLISRGSLQRLADADPDPAHPRLDARRFRMLIEIDGVDAHEEDRWIERELVVGEARLRMRGHVGRCVTTTRGPETGTVDHPTLKLLATYRREEATTEPLAFGVHGEVVHGGAVRVGDPVVLG